MKKLTEIKPWIKQLPNQLTLVRIAIVPFLLLVYPLDFFAIKVICAFFFLAAALTDALDGYVARKYDSVTKLGALLDPLADKMLVAACLILLVDANAVPALLAGILLCRDIGISGLRMVALEQNITISVNNYGKWKTILQDTAIFCLMINAPLFDLPFRPVGMIALWGALGLSVYSGYLYWKDFWSNAKTTIT